MLYPVPDPALHPRRPRSFPFAAFAIAWLAGLLAGCQSTGFGIANLGASASVASIVYAPRHGLALDVYRPVGALRFRDRGL